MIVRKNRARGPEHRGDIAFSGRLLQLRHEGGQASEITSRVRHDGEHLGHRRLLDPFMGSGSTGVSASLLSRNFTGYELSEDYFKIAKRRLQEAHDTLF